MEAITVLLNDFLARSHDIMQLILVIGQIIVALALSPIIKKYILKYSQNITWHFQDDIIKALLKLITPFSLVLVFGITTEILINLDLKHTLSLYALKISTVYLVLKTVSSINQGGDSFMFMAASLFIVVLEVFGLQHKMKVAASKAKLQLFDIDLTLYMVVKALLTLIIVYWIVSNVLQLGKKLIPIMTSDVNNGILYSKIFHYLLLGTTFLWILNFVGIQSSHIAMFGSALTLGIGFGLQKIAANFISGITILAEKNIKIGDIIEIDKDTKGRVKNLGMRAMNVTALDGREIVIPNENLINNQTVNFTSASKEAPSITCELVLQSADKVDLALQIIKDICQEKEKKQYIQNSMAIITEIKDTGVVIEVSFLYKNNKTCNVKEVKSELFKDILSAFVEKQIPLSFRKNVMITSDRL